MGHECRLSSRRASTPPAESVRSQTSSVVDVLITPLTSIIVSRFLLDLRQLRITVDLSLDTDTIAPAYDTATGGAPGDGSSHVEQITSQYSSTGYLSTFVGSMGAPLQDPVWTFPLQDGPADVSRPPDVDNVAP